MTDVVGVRFKRVGKIYYFNPNGMKIERGASVIVETSRGVEYGVVEIANREVDESKVVLPLKNVIREATENDVVQERMNKTREKDAFKICLEKIKAHGLDMKLIDVELTFDQTKIIFYFTSDGRVDFRELVRDLAAVFRMRIELRQIGVRDEAKMLNGIGICGRGLCCASFLGDFQPVSIKMAKEQSLSLNPTKISGICGRLMCCLKYEEETYEYLTKNLPEIGDVVETPDGKGDVLSVNVLRQQVKVSIMKKIQDDPTMGIYHVDDIDVISRSKTRKTDYKSGG
jgi:cell fate regulator YaaT (PSP1 superfamily)